MEYRYTIGRDAMNYSMNIRSIRWMEHFHERALHPSSTVIFVKTFQYSYADYTQHRHAIAVHPVSHF